MSHINDRRVAGVPSRKSDAAKLTVRQSAQPGDARQFGRNCTVVNPPLRDVSAQASPLSADAQAWSTDGGIITTQWFRAQVQTMSIGQPSPLRETAY